MTKLANLLALFVLVFVEFASAKTPVVLIPGLAGSWLEGRRSRGTWWCPTQPKYLPLWPNFNNSDYLCWEYDITVQYNKNTRKFVNYTDTGMEVRVLDWSGVSGILNVTIEGFYYPYYQDIVSNLTKVFGYKVYTDLFGAPFDWRLSPQSLGQYFIDLKALIQHAYSLNKAQVVVVAHSYGNLIFSQFLKGQTEAWKRAYIKEYLALSGPFLGSAEALAGAVFGIVGGFPAFPLHEVLETFPSLYYMSPSVHTINPVFDKLLFNVSQYHSTRPPLHFYVDRPSYRALMSDTYLSIGWDEYEIWNNEQFEPRFNPGVKVSCYYGTQLPTAQSYNVTLYGSTTVDSSSYDRDGDGVVLSNSGDYCKNWPNTRASGVPKASHLGILQTAEILKAIVTAITN